MSDTLSLNKLEKIIELETQLRGEYQQQLDEKDASIADLSRDKSALGQRSGVGENHLDAAGHHF